MTEGLALCYSLTVEVSAGDGVRNRAADAVSRRLPISTRVKHPVFPVVENDRRAFHRVPGVPLPVVEVAVPLVDLPIGERSHHRFLLTHRRDHVVGQLDDGERGAGPLVEEVLGEKQIPVPAAGGLERVAVDGEFQVREHPFSRVLERSGRLVGYRDPHFAVSRVVEVEFPVPLDDLRSPILFHAFDGIHRPADQLPVGEIPRAQDGELFPVRCLAGADGIVGVAHLEGVGVGEVTVPERVGVGDFPGAAGERENQGEGGGNGFHLHAGSIIRKVPREIEGNSRIAGGSPSRACQCLLFGTDSVAGPVAFETPLISWRFIVTDLSNLTTQILSWL
jgi:hypothetical protein